MCDWATSFFTFLKFGEKQWEPCPAFLVELANLHGRHQPSIRRRVSSLRDFGWVIPYKTREKHELPE